MKSYTSVTCPVSGKTVRLPYANVEEGVFAPAFDEDVDAQVAALPVGWGSLSISVVAANPEVAEVKRARKRDIQESMGALSQMVVDENLPEMQRKAVQAEIDSGKALANATRMVEDQHPMPESETVVLTLHYPVLSDEALGALVKVLKDAGFPIEGP